MVPQPICPVLIFPRVFYRWVLLLLWKNYRVTPHVRGLYNMYHILSPPPPPLESGVTTKHTSFLCNWCSPVSRCISHTNNFRQPQLSAVGYWLYVDFYYEYLYELPRPLRIGLCRFCSPTRSKTRRCRAQRSTYRRRHGLGLA